MAARFKDGDWVVNNYTGNMGYVTKVLNYSVAVHYTMHRGKVPIMPPEPRIYNKHEMDLALATKDYAWYEELQKLKGEKIDG